MSFLCLSLTQCFLPYIYRVAFMVWVRLDAHSYPLILVSLNSYLIQRVICICPVLIWALRETFFIYPAQRKQFVCSFRHRQNSQDKTFITAELYKQKTDYLYILLCIYTVLKKRNRRLRHSYETIQVATQGLFSPLPILNKDFSLIARVLPSC